MRKLKLKKLISAILVIAAVAALGGGVIALAKRDTKTIYSNAFSVGALDDNGEYTPNERAIYTKERFECIGLRVEPDFESQVTYDVYYYDYDDRLVHTVKGLSEVYDEDFPLAQYARIVIHPEIPEGVSKSDFKVKWYEVGKYADDVKITVDREQKYLYGNCVNLYNDANSLEGMAFSSDIGSVFKMQETVGAKCSERIALSDNYSYVDVFVRSVDEHYSSITSYTVVITNEDDVVVAKAGVSSDQYTPGEWIKVTIEIPSEYEDLSLYTRMRKDVECYIFGY